MEVFVPLGDRILVKVKSRSMTKKTDAGIILPDAPNKEPTVGVIVKIGDTVNEGLPVNRVAEGQTVQFEMYAGKPITVDGEDFLLVEMEKVEGKFK